MALPPTHIYKYIKEDPEDTFTALKKAGLLQKQSTKDKESIVSELAAKKLSYLNSRSENTGPNLQDIAAAALYKHLNQFGKHMADIELYSSTLTERFIIRLKKPVYRLKALFK